MGCTDKLDMVPALRSTCVGDPPPRTQEWDRSGFMEPRDNWALRARHRAQIHPEAGIYNPWTTEQVHNREYKELIPRWVWPAIPTWEEQKETGGVDGRHGLGQLWKERHCGLGKSGFGLVGERRTRDIGTEKHRWLTKSQQASPPQSPHYADGQCFTKPPLSLNDGFLCRLIYRFCRCLVQEYVMRESS